MSVRPTGQFNGSLFRDAGAILNGSTLTWSAWVKRRSTSGGSDGGGLLWLANAGSDFLTLATAASGASLQVVNDAGGNSSNLAMPLDVWRYLALISDATNARLRYRAEGETALTSGPNTVGAAPVATPTQMWVFQNDFDYADYEVRYMRAWAAVLSDAELQAESASASAVRTADLFEDWPLPNNASLTGVVNGRNWSASGTVADGGADPVIVTTPPTLGPMTPVS